MTRNAQPEPTQKIEVFCKNQPDQANTITTSVQPGRPGALNFTDGFPEITSTPLSAGGIPPERKDFNGMMKLFSEWLKFYGDGGVPSWQDGVTYPAGSMVLFNNDIFVARKTTTAETSIASDWLAILSKNDQQDQKIAAANQYVVGNLYWYTLPPTSDNRFFWCDGQKLESADVNFPKLWEKFLSLKKDPASIIPYAFVTEQEWQALWKDKGICGRFVLDEQAKTLRLPSLRGATPGGYFHAIDGFWEDKSALPNIVLGKFPDRKHRNYAAIKGLWYDCGNQSVPGTFSDFGTGSMHCDYGNSSGREDSQFTLGAPRRSGDFMFYETAAAGNKPACSFGGDAQYVRTPTVYGGYYIFTGERK